MDIALRLIDLAQAAVPKFTRTEYPNRRAAVRGETALVQPAELKPTSGISPSRDSFRPPSQRTVRFPRRTHQEGFDLPAARARRTSELTTLRSAVQAPLDRLQTSALAAR